LIENSELKIAGIVCENTQTGKATRLSGFHFSPISFLALPRYNVKYAFAGETGARHQRRRSNDPGNSQANGPQRL